MTPAMTRASLGEPPSRLQHAIEFAEQFRAPGNVAKHVIRKNRVESRFAKWQGLGSITFFKAHPLFAIPGSLMSTPRTRQPVVAATFSAYRPDLLPIANTSDAAVIR